MWNCGGEVVGNVNWGVRKAITDSYTHKITPYADGKQDGILECYLDESHDLLLHSMLKAAETCQSGAKDFMYASKCRNPKDYSEWRRTGAENTRYAVDSENNQELYMSNGRDLPFLTEPCQCTSDEFYNACICGSLARTSRTVLGDGTDPGRTDRPYAPEWVTNSAPEICNNVPADATEMQKRGLNGRRVCDIESLRNTKLWAANSPWDNSWDKYFRKQERDVQFFRKALWTKAELDNLANCASGNEQCTEMVLDLSVPYSNTQVYVLYRVPQSGSCLLHDLMVCLSTQNDQFQTCGTPPLHAVCIPTGTVPQLLVDRYDAVQENANIENAPQTFYVMPKTRVTTLTMGDFSEIWEAVQGLGGVINKTLTIEIDFGKNEACKAERYPTSAQLRGRCYNQTLHSFDLVQSGDQFSDRWSVMIDDIQCVRAFDYLVYRTCNQLTVGTDAALLAEVTGESSCRFKDMLNLQYDEGDWGTVYFRDLPCNGNAGVEVTSSTGGPKCYFFEEGFRQNDERLTYTAELQQQTTIYYPYYHKHEYATTNATDIRVFHRWGGCDPLVEIRFSDEYAEVYVNNELAEDGLVEQPKGNEKALFEFRSSSPFLRELKSFMRELCFGIAENPFARSFTRSDVEDVPLLEYDVGDCQQCVTGGFTAIVGAEVDRASSVLPGGQFGTDSVAICYAACANSTECFAFSFARRTCTMHDEHPSLGQPTALVPLSTTTSQALASDEAIIVFCMNGTTMALPPPRSVAAPVAECDPEYVGLVPNCRRSNCDGNTERALGIDQFVRCDHECETQCGTRPHRSLQFVLPVPRASAWGTNWAATSFHGDYRLQTTLSLAEGPYFTFNAYQIETPSITETGVLSIAVQLPLLTADCEASPQEDVSSLPAVEFSGFTATLTADGEFVATVTMDSMNYTDLYTPTAHRLVFLPTAPLSMAKGRVFKVTVQPPALENETLSANCCSGMTAECLACQQGLPLYVFCGRNPNFAGCVGVSAPVGQEVAFRMPGSTRHFCNSTYEEAIQVVPLIEAYIANLTRDSPLNSSAGGILNTNITLDELFEHVFGSNYVHAGFTYDTSSTFSVASIKYCRTNAGATHLCVPHSTCAETEYKVRNGDLHSDTVCAPLTSCRFDEHQTSAPTPTSDRVCTPHTVCSGTQARNTSGTAFADAVCMLRGACAANEVYADDGGCTAAKVCRDTDERREVRPFSMFSQAVCAKYEVECNAIEYETEGRTPSTERTCTEATLCRSDEFVSTPGSPIEDRACDPILKCGDYEIETKQGTIVRQAECTSILQWSSVWVYTAVGASGFVLATVRRWRV
jgi:hypothetical protein